MNFNLNDYPYDIPKDALVPKDLVFAGMRGGLIGPYVSAADFVADGRTRRSAIRLKPARHVFNVTPELDRAHCGCGRWKALLNPHDVPTSLQGAGTSFGIHVASD